MKKSSIFGDILALVILGIVLGGIGLYFLEMAPSL